MINETLNGPVINFLSSFWGTFSVVIGGIFGIYVLIFLFRVLEFHKLRKIEKDIKELKRVILKEKPKKRFNFIRKKSK